MKKRALPFAFGIFFLWGCQFSSPSAETPISTPPPTPRVEEVFKTVQGTTDTKELSKFANDEAYTVRAFSGQNPNTPAEYLWKLSDDKDLIVRTYLATNPNLPPELFKKLSQDPSEDVRKKIAQNPGVSMDILLTLCGDTDTVQTGILQNPSLSEETLITIIKKITSLEALQTFQEKKNFSPAVEKAIQERSPELR